jgi:hypothetical protein
MKYLSICAIYRWEGPYLREWVAFHRAVGVERFFLYDNNSEDEHLEALAPYVDEGTVELRHWPMYPNGQWPAYEHCLGEHAQDSRWIAFIDVDEFLFSPTGLPLPEVLTRYERWPGVGVTRVTFGTSGHERRPAGLVLENYTRRLERGKHASVKSIVDPARTLSPFSPHTFEYSESHAVDEQEQPLEGAFSPTGSTELLRINHYYTKSEEEMMLKLSRPGANGQPRKGANPRPGKGIRGDQRFGVPDDTVLRYLPALRAELARVGAG